MGRVGRLLDFLGGSLGRMAGTGVATGLFMILVGMSPAEFAECLFRNPPAFLSVWWFKLGLLLLGLVLIWVSLRFNIWSKQQQSIDSLAEDISGAISKLVNRSPRPTADSDIDAWERDFNQWCGEVSAKLGNRAFFTRTDQLHFDRLGFIEQVQMSGDARFDWLLSQLRLKFERLRDVINWTQQRKR